MLLTDQRLRANRDFRRVYARAKSHVHPLAVIYVLCRTIDQQGEANVTLHARIGFVVSKKQGCAVIRNRIKRRLREAVRARIDPTIQAMPCDIVFVARKGLYTVEWLGVRAAVDDLLRRSGLSHSNKIDRQQTSVTP